MPTSWTLVQFAGNRGCRSVLPGPLERALQHLNPGASVSGSWSRRPGAWLVPPLPAGRSRLCRRRCRLPGVAGAAAEEGVAAVAVGRHRRREAVEMTLEERVAAGPDGA